MYINIKDLIHYIAYITKDKPKLLGATKLNKALWFIDTFYFLETGKSLTNTRYVRRRMGPVPSWETLNNALDNLEHSGDITIKKNDFHGYLQTNYVANTKPNVNFGKKQKNLVDEIIDIITTKHTAGSISEISHDEIWGIAEDGEELPIYTCLVSKNGNVTDEMRKWAKQCVQ